MFVGHAHITQSSVLSPTQWRTHGLMRRRARENVSASQRTSVKYVQDAGIDLDFARAVRGVVAEGPSCSLSFLFLTRDRASTFGAGSKVALNFVFTFVTDAVLRINAGTFMGCAGERRDAHCRQGLYVTLSGFGRGARATPAANPTLLQHALEDEGWNQSGLSEMCRRARVEALPRAA